MSLVSSAGRTATSALDKIVSVSALAMAMKIAKKANMMMAILILNDLVMSL